MATSSLPVLEPRLQLTVENKIKTIFVTQSEDTRQRKEENVNFIPVVTEPPSRLLETGVNTFRRTLVLKKQAELDQVEHQLTLKRLEFRNRMEALAQRRAELEVKQEQAKEKVKFEKFVAENEAKRRQALKKQEDLQELNISKQREIEELNGQLDLLRARQQVLKERMSKYKIYEDYLMRTLDCLPRTYLHNSSESLVTPLIRQHDTLTITHRQLLQRFGRLEEAVEHQRQLHIRKREDNVKTLVASRTLSELQAQLETLKGQNKQAEVSLLTEKALVRVKVEEVACLLMAVNNLAVQCYLSSHGPLKNMNILTMMDMVKEFILDKADTERRARRLMESGSPGVSRTALKTHIKQSRKVRKSETKS